jgi:hypothetical protein
MYAARTRGALFFGAAFFAGVFAAARFLAAASDSTTTRGTLGTMNLARASVAVPASTCRMYSQSP